VLKVFGVSPADQLVQNLFERTTPIILFSVFLVGFGSLEMAIGILSLFEGAERIVIPLLFIHMTTTFLPLFALPQETWSVFLAPTLEGNTSSRTLPSLPSRSASPRNWNRSPGGPASYYLTAISTVPSSRIAIK
jgi:hypothetical protein